ncbi:hypothetical protein MASR1M6_38080 [Rubrivivax sp.]
MESTGVYWIALYELLDARGFTVLLVNARHVKNVSGRKSDVLDCQWLQQLMSYGLLRARSRPDDAVCCLRALVRQRATILRTASRSVQHCKGAGADEHPAGHRHLRRGRRLGPERSCAPSWPASATAGRWRRWPSARIKASAEEIAASLQGHWRAEHLFALKQALAASTSAARGLLGAMLEIEAHCACWSRAEPAAGEALKARNAPSSTCAGGCSGCAAWI